jgi:RHS repeat-associated protein
MLNNECDLNVATGEVSQSYMDVFWPGRPPFSLLRVYSSVNPTDGPFGWGWRHNLCLSLWRDGKEMVLGGSGSGEDRFLKDGSGGLSTASGALAIEWGAAVRVREKNGSCWWFEPANSSYDSPFRLIAREDRDGNRLQYLYRSAQLSEVIDAEQRHLRIVYDLNGRIEALYFSHFSEPSEILVAAFVYDHRGDLVRSSDRSGIGTEYAYDHHRLVEVSNRKGGKYFFAYDATGAGICRWRSDGGRVRYFRRDPLKKRVEMTDSRGNRWLYKLDDKGQIIQRVDPLRRVHENVYDPNGGLLLSTLEGGVSCVSFFDDQARTETVDCAGRETKITYNDFDEAVRIEAPGSRVTTFEYDAMGHLIGTTGPDRAAIRFTYTSFGDVKSVVDPRGNETLWESNGLLTRCMDKVGPICSSKDDTFGNLRRFSDPYGNETKFVYDRSGQLIATVFPDGGRQEYGYDAAGYPVEIRYENGAILKLESDAFGRPTGWTDGVGARFAVDWDTEDNYVRVVNPAGETLEFTYDGVNRLVQAKHYDGRLTNIENDDDDHPVRFVNPATGMQSLASFDALGNVRERSATLAPHWRFAYGPEGELTQAASELGDWTVDWSDECRWLGEQTPQRKLEISRDAIGQRLQLKDDRGIRIDYEWDRRSRLCALTVNSRWRWQFEYDLRDLLVRAVTPGNMVISFAYDSMQRMLQRELTAADGRTLAFRRFEWAPSDDLIAVDDWRMGRRRLEVDAVGRLLRVRGAGIHEDYAHDMCGNVLVSATGAAIHLDRGNRALSCGGTQFTHNADGHISRRVSGSDVTEYTYDGDGLLINVRLPSGVVVENQYDFLGRRIAKSVDGQTTRYFWDGEFIQGRCAHDGDTEYYITLPESPIPLGMLRDDKMFVLLFDQIGTVTEAFGEDGKLAWAPDYTSFGYLRGESGEIDQPLRALGQYHDRETGLYYNYFRHYDPLLGAYISADPTGYTYGQNLYWYSSNPYEWVDVDGQGSLANGVLTLTWRCDWTEKQKRDFKAKIADQNRRLAAKGGAKVSLPAPDRPCGTAAKKWKDECKKQRGASKRPVKNTGDPCVDNDADHRLELVLGGKDACKNMTPRNASVNRSVGSQIGNVLNKAQEQGKKSVTITNVVASKKCKKPDRKTEPCKDNWSANATL